MNPTNDADIPRTFLVVGKLNRHILLSRLSGTYNNAICFVAFIDNELNCTKNLLSVRKVDNVRTMKNTCRRRLGQNRVLRIICLIHLGLFPSPSHHMVSNLGCTSATSRKHYEQVHLVIAAPLNRLIAYGSSNNRPDRAHLTSNSLHVLLEKDLQTISLSLALATLWPL